LTMAKQPPARGKYYYAGGEKVELAPADDLLAVDEQALNASAVPKAVAAAVRMVIHPLADRIGLVSRADLGPNGPDIVRALESAGATHPVFRSHGAVLVVLPEVRVEESRGAKQKHLADWLASRARDALIESRNEDRMVLRPASGYGGDALTLANQLAEQVGPEMAQARFLRVTQRPSAVRV